MQGEQEGVAEFMAELRRLADRCRFGGHLEEALRDRLVCGLRNAAAQKKLLAEEDLTLARAYETAVSMEMAARQAGHLKGQETSTADQVGMVRRQFRQGPPRGQRPPQASHHAAPGSNSCFRCGKSGHSPDKCYFKRQKCRQCGKYGHIQKMCKNRQLALVEEPDLEDAPDTQDEEYEEDVLLHVKAVGPAAGKGRILVSLHVDNRPLTMELDTGASVSVISQKTWKTLFPDRQLELSDIQLQTYSGEPLPVLGQISVCVRYKQQEKLLPLVVVEGRGAAIFGCNWLPHITLQWDTIQHAGGAYLRSRGFIAGVLGYLRSLGPRGHQGGEGPS